MKTTKPSEINKETFDEISQAEEWYYKQHSPRIRILMEIFKSIENKEIVADIGCFTGIISQEYFKHGAKIVEGFDVSEKALEKASKRLTKVYKWKAGEEVCPVENERYDVIIASEIIEHVFDTDFFIEELKRILKPNGRIIITTPNMHSAINRLLFLMGKFPWFHPGISTRYNKDPRICLEHVRLGNLSEWKYFFEKHNLMIEKVIGINYSLLGKFISLSKTSLSHYLAFVLKNINEKNEPT
jgi:2-polyprenyl-3-methyl-5-hydroxy-6-metoxy-1,4-benzoquinol methylase